MSQLNRFIHQLTITLPDEYEALHQLWISCASSDPICPLCTFLCEKGEETCKRHRVKCTFLIQSGKRKGLACEKTVKRGNRCSAHIGLTMCTREKCQNVSDKQKEICLAHIKEEKQKLEIQKPYFSIRYRGPHYIIHKTQVVIDPMYNTVVGYVEGNQVKYESSPEVERVCARFHLKMVLPQRPDS